MSAKDNFILLLEVAIFVCGFTLGIASCMLGIVVYVYL
jgi:hypothetical protein